ncbi:MAG TPA: hypothetical protein V6D22_04350 [Candidatus Obscuribacterales bacterium]
MEALVTTVIMGILSMAFMAVLLMNYKTNAKLDNMQDTLNAVRAIKERISKDVREGRSLGDVYGTQTTDPANVDPLTGLPIPLIVGSAGFPSSNDPVYGGNSPPPQPTGWPAATVSSPYTLSNQCLIVQIPVLDDHADTSTQHFRDLNQLGWPTQIPASFSSSGIEQDNVETHVYRVVADPSNAGEYLLQFASFGGAGGAITGFTGYNSSVHTFGPQTLVSGIIGPIDSVTGLPKVFQFISPKRSGTPVDSIPNPSYTAEYTGVVCNLEIRRHQDMSTHQKNFSVTPIGMKIEVFLRNNALATSAGAPSQ